MVEGHLNEVSGSELRRHQQGCQCVRCKVMMPVTLGDKSAVGRSQLGPNGHLLSYPGHL